jgi:ribosomal protein S18 acetylase RimI-like enzyme
MSGGINLRTELRAADVDAIRALVRDTGVFSEEEINVAGELAEETLAKGPDLAYHFLIAEQDGNLLGYSCYGRIPLTQASYDLYWIVVDNKKQNRGIASFVMERTQDAIRALGGKQLYTETSSRSVYAPAQSFYLKHAFAEIARFEDFYSDGDDKIVYGKKLY